MRKTDFKKLEENAQAGMPVEYSDDQLVNARTPMELPADLLESEPSAFDIAQNDTEMPVQQQAPAVNPAKAKLEALLNYKNQMRDQVAKRQSGNNDNYKQAQSKFDQLNRYSNLLRGFQGIIQGGGQAGDASFRSDMGVADNLAKQADTSLKEYYNKNTDKRAEMDNELSQEKDLQGLQDNNMKLYNAEQAVDPSSDPSAFLRKLVLKDNPQLAGGEIDNMSESQLAKYLDYMKALKVAQLKRTTSDKGRFQAKAYTDPKSGQIKYGVFDTTTGLIAEGDKLTGYAPAAKTNPYTQDTEIINKSLGTAAPVIRADSDTQGKAGADSEYEKLNPAQRKDFAQVQKTFETRVKDDNAAINKLDDINALAGQVASGSQTAMGPLKASVARMFEKGVLTDADIDRYVQRYDAGGKVKDMLHTIAYGSPSPDTLKQIVSTLQTLKKVKERTVRSEGRELVKGFHNKHKGDLDAKKVNAEGLGNILSPDMQEGTVLLQSPDGQQVRVKESAAQKYLDKGATLVPE